MKIAGLDVGSTTVKAALVDGDRIVWRDYQRHNTRQAEKVLEFLERMETEAGLAPGVDRVFVTGSGAGSITALIGAKYVQEVVAVAACVERLHPEVRFVSEIGGEDMKTIFFTDAGAGKSKQVFMQSACSGGTGTFIEKTARKLQVAAERLATMGYAGLSLHKVSSKCGIFAETDANTLVKTGVPVEEIIASLFEAVVYQNLATLTKGNTPMPTVLLLGGPNLFFKGLQEAWRHHLMKLWTQRGVLGGDQVGSRRAHSRARGRPLLRVPRLRGDGPGRDRRRGGLSGARQALLVGHRGPAGAEGQGRRRGRWSRAVTSWHPSWPATPGARPAPTCSTPAVRRRARPPGLRLRQHHREGGGALAGEGAPLQLLRHLEGQSRSRTRSRSSGRCGRPGFTRCGRARADRLRERPAPGLLGADVAIVETVAHATAALHYVPDADVICDVGGTDVKIMLLRQGTVADFRLNSQCSSGNGAFLQGVAERYGIPLEGYADRAFTAKAMPSLAMGCGVFLQSDIVNQQRKGWAAEEIMAALAAVLPVNVWIYAGQLQNLRAAGRKFVLQGGTHRNMAVVKAQTDFITGKVPDAEVVLHPYSGEAGAIGAALCAGDWRGAGKPSRFRGFDVIEALTYVSTTKAETVCKWCPVNCTRTFIDVQLPGAAGRAWSKVPLAPGWERVISGNSCPKGLVEDANEMRTVKAKLEEVKREYPNVAEMVRKDAFRRARPAPVAR